MIKSLANPLKRFMQFQSPFFSSPHDENRLWDLRSLERGKRRVENTVNKEILSACVKDRQIAFVVFNYLYNIIFTAICQ